MNTVVHPLSLGASQGSALLMALVILGILAMIAATSSGAASNYVTEAKRIEAVGQKDDLARAIKTKMNCAATKAQAPQNGSTQDVILRDRRGYRLDGGNRGPLSIAGWEIRVTAWNRHSGHMVISAQGKHGRTADLFESTPLICR